jgi:hypothetical protein
VQEPPRVWPRFPGPRIKTLLPSSPYPLLLLNLPTLTKTFDPSTISAYSRDRTPRSAPSSSNHLELRLLFVPDLISLPSLLRCPSRPSPTRHLTTSSLFPPPSIICKVGNHLSRRYSEKIRDHVCKCFDWFSPPPLVSK